MIEAFATNGANHPLNIGALPRRSACRQVQSWAVARGKILGRFPADWGTPIDAESQVLEPSEARDRKLEAKMRGVS